MQSVLEKIKKCAESDRKSVFELLASLTEEVGELSRALKIKAMMTGTSHKTLEEEPKIEAIDVAICALAMYYAQGGGDELESVFHNKLDKWTRMIDARLADYNAHEALKVVLSPFIGNVCAAIVDYQHEEHIGLIVVADIAMQELKVGVTAAERILGKRIVVRLYSIADFRWEFKEPGIAEFLSDKTASDFVIGNPSRLRRLSCCDPGSDLINMSQVLATRAHEGQSRKYSDKPYIVHPAEVAKIVSGLPNVTEEEIAAAWLHDVIEDCDASFTEELRREFPAKVVSMVDELTNVSKNYPFAPRKERKEMDIAKLRTSSREARRIKLIDRDCNIKDMSDAPGGFRRLYLKESRDLLEALRGTDPLLEAILETRIIELEKKSYEIRKG